MRFSFGKNWLSYSQRALEPEKVAAARRAFNSLTRGIEMRGARFLDIGFGQGLALFFAAESGADVFGIDLDPFCREALRTTANFFSSRSFPKIEIVSILDDDFVRRQEAVGRFDVVHSWGVLHHTANMAKAFRNTAALVKSNGHLIISIYNRHWTSPVWHTVKWTYNHLPRFLQEGMVLAAYPVFYLRACSLRSEDGELALRGMDLGHDVRDWLGGYPYEYASPIEVEEAFSELGFRMLRSDVTKGFTGCNEFVFQKQM
jgi:SAM-dependent methyltransferase